MAALAINLIAIINGARRQFIILKPLSDVVARFVCSGLSHDNVVISR
jgi:hypothetical protein